jgi:hypothetical protein
VQQKEFHGNQTKTKKTLLLKFKYLLKEKKTKAKMANTPKMFIIVANMVIG